MSDINSVEATHCRVETRTTRTEMSLKKLSFTSSHSR